jgi:hypothetical protein
MMPIWPFGRNGADEVPETDDVEEARAQRARAEAELRAARIRGFGVSALASELVERRALNHFGEAIQITFTRRV